MATSFHQYSPRAQALICLTLAVFAFGAGWQLLLGPEREVVAERQQRLAILEADVARARQASQRLSDVQASIAALEVALARSTAILPDEKDAQEVLRGLHQLASESNLSINSFTPKPAADQATFTEWPIDLGLEGGYHDLGVFFDRVATEARLISVANLHLKTNTMVDGRRGQVSATCTATTYVFGSPVRPSPTAPGGPGTPGSGT
ncbi:MAG: type 4a pilus biogenesis protein PilO [Acidobacteria bacterium]|nr:type 4a pilus biogenesis protein PilO [Acidobacteriota bacterium]